MRRLHKEILTKEQRELLPLVHRFSKNFSLVGGTAVALYVGHRESMDFDLFSIEKFNNFPIRKKISDKIKIDNIVVNKPGEFTILIKEVKMTFFHYPFGIKFKVNFDDIIKMPDLLTLAAMKAYALGMRAKWKDYVDLYFIMEKFYSIDKIVKKAKSIFRGEFNERMFRTQLAYFNDINYDEEIIFKKGFWVDEKTMKKALVDFSLK